MNLTPQSIRTRLATKIIGRKIICAGTVESTNDTAWAAALDGAEDGTAVFAEEQRQGRGRHGRTWFAPKGGAILCSVILRRPVPVERVPLVTAVAALAVSDAVRDVAGFETQIRFPNDVVVGGRKVAGVLVESRFISGWPDLFIVGIGINVNVARADFPRDVRDLATSMSIEKGMEVNRVHAARALLESLERWTDEIVGNMKEIRREWRGRSEVLGAKVRVTEKGKTYAGRVEGIDPIEGVEVRLDTGAMRLFRGEHIERLVLEEEK